MNIFDRLGLHVASEQDALRSRSSHRALVRARLSTIDPRRDRRISRPATIAIAVLAASLVAAGVFAIDRERRAHAPLTATFGTSNQRANVGTWLEAPAARPLPLHFSDGTRVDMAPGSRARLVELTPAGAHLLLEVGTAHFTVARRPRAAWHLSVGPFAVHVTGTRFDVRWDPDVDAFELSLEEGQVDLSGCMFGDAHRLWPGERARASCKGAYVEIVDRRSQDIVSGRAAVTAGVASDGAAVAASGNAVPAAVESPKTPGSAPPVLELAPRLFDAAVVSQRRGEAHRSAGRDPSVAWRELAEHGRYADALAAANEAGFELECAQANADDLALLGDVARYAGDPGRAARALQLLRRRFPGGARAATAAFTLGRLDFDGANSFARAAEWFRTYLKEQPNGPLAREARGRLMEALHRAGDNRSAREIAQQYLRDYPAGPHATLAKDLRNSTDP